MNKQTTTKHNFIKSSSYMFRHNEMHVFSFEVGPYIKRTWQETITLNKT